MCGPCDDFWEQQARGCVILGKFEKVVNYFCSIGKHAVKLWDVLEWQLQVESKGIVLLFLCWYSENLRLIFFFKEPYIIAQVVPF